MKCYALHRCCTKCNSQPINGQCTIAITVLLYSDPLLCSFHVCIKVLSCRCETFRIGNGSQIVPLNITPKWVKLNPEH